VYLLGLDVGSSSVKAAIVEAETSRCVASVKYPDMEMKIHSPHKNWAEQHPDDWWAYTKQAILKAIKEASISASDISAIGISYQMHGLVCLDKDGVPVRPSIIWCDSRAVKAGAQLTSKVSASHIKDNIYNLLGNFTAAKLLWVKEHEVDTYNKIHKVMLPGDYIAYKLSGEYTTSFSGLSEGIFWDFKNHILSKEVLSAGGFDEALFPTIGTSFETLCGTDAAAKEALGINVGTPISYRAGDQPNNAFSLGVINSGEAAATGGTSGVVYAVSDQVNFDPQSRVNSFAHVNHTKDKPSIGTLLCINGTGIQYNWIRANMYPASSYPDMEYAASAVPIGADDLVAIPFGNGAERMLGNKVAGASIHNLDFNRHDKAHVVRAGLEGIAFAFQYGLEALAELGIKIKKVKAGNDNLFQSKIFSQTLATAADIEIYIYETTGAVGAAKGAGFGAKILPTIEDAIKGIEIAGEITPEFDKAQVDEAYQKWKEKLTNQ
jgi:xylulokinase